MKTLTIKNARIWETSGINVITIPKSYVSNGLVAKNDVIPLVELHLEEKEDG